MIELVKDKTYNLSEIEREVFSSRTSLSSELVVVFPNQNLVRFQRTCIPWKAGEPTLVVLATTYYLILKADHTHAFWIGKTNQIERHELEQFLKTLSSLPRCFPDKLFQEEELLKIWEDTRIKPSAYEDKPKTLKERFSKLFNFIEI